MTLQQFPTLGVSACVWRQGRALIIQRAKPPLVGIWSLPGGHVDPGETVLAAAQRELLEETGVEASFDHLVGLFDVIRRDGAGELTVHYVIACYTGHWRSGEARAGSDALSVRWIEPSEVPGLSFTPGVPEAIRKAKTLAGL